jgi:hypothetical protein
MTKAHRHHIDGMARAGGDFWIFGEHLGSNAARWPRTTPWLEVLAEGQAFGMWLCSKRSACGRGSGGTGGCPAVPFRADTTWTAARRYLTAAPRPAPAPKKWTGPRLR